ncbi:MAG: DUF2868 domain-containing protein [Luteolibacter sp.]
METRWTLEDLIDFEHEISGTPEVTSGDTTGVVAATRGLEGAPARRAGLHAWLRNVRKSSPGNRYTAALGWIAAGIAALFFLSGASAVVGLLHDPEKRGINVVLFLALLLGPQWLILLASFLAFLFRRKAAEGFSAFQALLGFLARRGSGEGANGWWHGLMESGTHARSALLWRLARHAQGAGIFFNLGILSGLAGLVLARHIGFYWETTTDEAMRSLLERLVAILSLPWAAFWPSAVPSAEIIAATRWLPESPHTLAPGPAEWWKFLLATITVWGLLPRIALRVLAGSREKSALAAVDFQGRHHRVLWRKLTGTTRTESESAPCDGVLVLAVGGFEIPRDRLRPYFLRNLRVNPHDWLEVGTLSADPAKVAKALEKAPAGVVVLAEGWALSPPRMTRLHGEIRKLSGQETPIKFVALNLAADGSLSSPTPDESREWERFTDSLRDPMAEVFFYQNT